MGQELSKSKFFKPYIPFVWEVVEDKEIVDDTAKQYRTARKLAMVSKTAYQILYSAMIVEPRTSRNQIALNVANLKKLEWKLSENFPPTILKSYHMRLLEYN